MGFNFIAGHISEVMDHEAAGRTERALRDRFGDALPLAVPGEVFCMPDELGWSWWSGLQSFAEETLGAEGSRHIRAVDACHAVYLDIDAERALIRFADEPEPEDPPTSQHVGGNWWYRLLALFGRGPYAAPEAIGRAMLTQMILDYGAREGERGALQVGGLRGLMAELDKLLGFLGTEVHEDAVQALLRTYTDDDARVDDDPHIQCLCHAWLTGHLAVERGWPLWLMK